ncbi:MAG TPA: lactonase family protein [Planctomycetaceae bacterium]|nr:lactonase family protein [Planctomycetaceae bacterium]
MILLAAQAAPDSHVYVSVAAEKRIAVFVADGDDGQLRHLQDAACEAEPGALAVSPDGRVLVAALRSSGQLSSFRRDPQTGKLTPVNTVAAGDDPAQLSLDGSGRFVFTAYYVAAKVTVHALDREGKLSAEPLQSIPTADKAHAIVLEKGGRHAFVSHTGSDVIFQFRWDGAKQRLSPGDPLRLTTRPGTGPRHIVFHPRLPLAYVSNEQANSVTAYRFDPKSGTLKAEQTVPSLPEGFDGRNATAEIRIHPSGKQLFCANRGHDSLARYSVDDEGRLKFLGTTPTEKTPRSFDIDPAGKFLYAAGESSGKLVCYRIDEERGDLKPAKAIEVGPKLWWVLCAPVGR